MALSQISISGFTVFDKLTIDLSSGINVFIGDNGTGKTHLLKLLYAMSECCVYSSDHIFGVLKEGYISKCFQLDRNDKLIRCKDSIGTESYNRCGSSELELTFTNGSQRLIVLRRGFPPIDFLGETGHIHSSNSVFIPAKEMLTHSGLENDYMSRNLPFDVTLIEILIKAGVSTVKVISDELMEILQEIASTIGGKVVYENGRYLVVKDNGNTIDFAAEAEGYKKLGLLYRLIETGNIAMGSVLFWDEPEANINPKNIPILVNILLLMQKAGVQVFLATHNYFLAKYFEVRKRPDHCVIFHSMYLSNGATQVESSEDFTTLDNNPIIEQSIELYAEEITRVIP